MIDSPVTLLLLCALTFNYAVLQDEFPIAKQNSRLVEGEPAESGQFPYAVSLRNRYNDVCGGVIISPKHILTEAWCTNAVPNMTIIAGCVDYESPDCVEYELEAIEVHPNYTSTGVHDIGIISVVGSIEMNHFVRSIPVSSEYVEANTLVTVMGWSPQHQLLWKDIQVAEEAACDEKWVWGPPEAVICTSSSIVGAGDYGCPLVADGLLVGFPVDSLSTFDVHQRVSEYVDWINSVIVTY